jgi:hypothetical protein
MENEFKCHRRKFIKSLSGIIVGIQLVTTSGYGRQENSSKKLWDEFSEDEKKQIQASVMAVDILNYPKQGFSCAGSILACSLKFLDKSEEISHVSSSFGGGIGRFDLCGLLTGGHMAIGVSAGMIHTDVKERQNYARTVSNKYWDWWESWAPKHCHQLRPRYDSEGYTRMIQRVALKVEELIKPALSQ